MNPSPFAWSVITPVALRHDHRQADPPSGIVKRAFRECEVEPHWMAPAVQRSRTSGVAQQIENAVWYRSYTVAGRLVGNRQSSDHRGAHWRGRISPLFISTVPRKRDQLGLQLRHEAGWLAADTAAGRLLSMPAPTRDDDDVDERIECLCGYTDLRAFTADRLAQKD